MNTKSIIPNTKSIIPGQKITDNNKKDQLDKNNHTHNNAPEISILTSPNNNNNNFNSTAEDLLQSKSKMKNTRKKTSTRFNTLKQKSNKILPIWAKDDDDDDEIKNLNIINTSFSCNSESSDENFDPFIINKSTNKNTNTDLSSNSEHHTNEIYQNEKEEKIKKEKKKIETQGSQKQKKSVGFFCEENTNDEIQEKNRKSTNNEITDKMSQLDWGSLDVSESEDDGTGFEVHNNKVFIRTKTMIADDAEIVCVDRKSRASIKGSKKERTSSRTAKISKLQSIYAKGDFFGDEDTVKCMVEMVTGFNEVSTVLHKCVRRQTQYALIGLILNVIQREVDYYSGIDLDYYHSGRMFSPWKIIVHILRAIVSLTTCLMIYNFYLYHSNNLKFQSLNKVFMSWEGLWNSSRNYMPFLKDCLLYATHEPPFINIQFNLAVPSVAFDEIIYIQNVFGLFMFLRVLLLLRYASNEIYKGGTKILGIWHNFNFGTPFTIRNLLYVHPLRTLMPVYCAAVAISWYCLYVCEREAPSDVLGSMKDPWDSLWVLLVTVTTVGYGDAYPATTCGRGTLVITAFMSQCLFAVIISTLHQKLHLMPFESKMVEFLAHADSFKKIKTYAANVIQQGWKLGRAKRKLPESKRKTYRGPELSRFTNSVYKFERHRNTVQAYDRRYRNDQLIRSMLEDISNQCEEAKIYYSAANQIAAATGRALKLTTEKKQRNDGTFKTCVEREFEITDERHSVLGRALDGEVPDLPTRGVSFAPIDGQMDIIEEESEEEEMDENENSMIDQLITSQKSMADTLDALKSMIENNSKVIQNLKTHVKFVEK